MKINFIGNYAQGYVGERADEDMLADSLIDLGHEVRKVPRDIWKAFCDGENDDKWIDKLPGVADFNIIAKWHHFADGRYIDKLKEVSKAPVFYWVWDYMQAENWHDEMRFSADIYLANDVYSHFYGSGFYPTGSNMHYFPMDVADEKLEVYEPDYKHNVAFFGSYLGQGDRVEWLKKIDKEVPVMIWSWNAPDWTKNGFTAFPAVYGNDFNKKVSQTKICLQFSVNDHTWGYWSNRIGKTLLAGGFLLCRYAPGMELFLKDGVAYFNSPEEAIEKIKFYLKNDSAREKIRKKGAEIGRQHFTSKQRCKDLVIFAENYLRIAVG